MTNHIRNFCIIAHINHGKSTLADRLLELTGTVPKNKMHAQFLDRMPLEQERGITIKMQPVRINYSSGRGINEEQTQTEAELPCNDLTRKIRGILLAIKKNLGLGHNKPAYHNALEAGLREAGLRFESKKNIPLFHNKENGGTYQPDFVVEDKILIELKTLPEIDKHQLKQMHSYLKGCKYKLAILGNFGPKELDIRQIAYEAAGRQQITRTFASVQGDSAGGSHHAKNFVLNLIDTPGHTDFSYEVSRSLKAVEGAVLLVEAAKGVQAQTVSNYELAKQQGLVIIPAINKVDLPEADVAGVKAQLAKLTGLPEERILGISAKSGLNVPQVLERIVSDIPAPQSDSAAPLKALIFDSTYDPFKGVIVYVRVFEGAVKAGDSIAMFASKAKAKVKEVGVFTPDLTAVKSLEAGSIGYIATGLKDITLTSVGDTVVAASALAAAKPLSGYAEMKPRVFASFYPVNEDNFDDFTDALSRLKLNDASLSYQLENSAALGRGYRVGFLGTLHLEITIERLKREFGQDIIVTSPSVAYRTTYTDQGKEKTKIISSPAYLPPPAKIVRIEEPWVRLEVTTPTDYLGGVMNLLNDYRAEYEDTAYLTPTMAIVKVLVPLADIMQRFHDRLKSVSSGYASADYQEIGYRPWDLVKLEFLVAHDLVEAFSRVVPRERAYAEGARVTRQLKEFIPQQLFTVAIQARINGGKIIARQDIRAMRKDVTGYLYGGDYTRKRKLLEKQKRGKKRMLSTGRVNIPKETFLKLVTN